MALFGGLKDALENLLPKHLLSPGHELVLADLMNIDEGRINRSAHILITKKQKFIVEEDPSRFRKLLRFVTGKPVKINSVVMKYHVRNVVKRTEYDVFIKCGLHNNEKEALNQHVFLFCYCKDFFYRSVWTLNKKNALFRNAKIDALCATPLTVAPTKVIPTLACKHCYKCMCDFVRHYKEYVLLE